MKKKFAIAFVAILAVVVCAVSFTACNGGNGDVKKLYESFLEIRDKLEPVTTMTATELGDLNGTTVTVSGKALIAQRTDPDTSETAYELWVNSPKEMSPLMTQVYSGDIKPKEVPYGYPGSSETADWCWYVNDTAMKMINVYTVDVNQFFGFKYEGNSIRTPYVTGNVLYVDGVEVLEYDPLTDTVTEIGETTGSISFIST